MDDVRPRPTTRKELAEIIDYALLAPASGEAEVHAGCLLARSLGLASVVVRPSDVEMAALALEGCAVRVGSVAAFPHGNATTAVKLYEVNDLLRRGAREIGLTLNAGKMRSRQFAHIESEMMQAASACRSAGALFGMVIEPGGMDPDLKVIACRVAKRVEADWLTLGSGFGAAFAAPAEAAFFAERLAGRVAIRVGFAAADLEGCLTLYEAGCARLVAADPAAILAEWDKRLEKEKAGPGDGQAAGQTPQPKPKP